MKRMLLFHYSYGYEEVWDTGKRKTTINEYRKKPHCIGFSENASGFLSTIHGFNHIG